MKRKTATKITYAEGDYEVDLEISDHEPVSLCLWNVRDESNLLVMIDQGDGDIAEAAHVLSNLFSKIDGELSTMRGAP